MSRRIRTYAEVGGEGSGDIPSQVGAQLARLGRRLDSIAGTVVVASGKGGVGKSLITANLAAILAQRGLAVGVLDADLNGPSIAAMLGAERTPLAVTPDGVLPARSSAGCTVMSMDLLLESPDAEVRWREPADGGFVWQSTLETGVLRELLADTAWGSLDLLLIDMPPGTDRIARLLGLLPSPSAALLVTTPSAASAAVVARSITQLRAAGVAALGLVSNMDGYVCGVCGSVGSLFAAAAVDALVARSGIPLWAAVPFDPALGSATDSGRAAAGCAPDSPAARALERLADLVQQHASSPRMREAGS